MVAGYSIYIYYLDLSHSTAWAGFTAAQRERAQEDFKVLYEGAPPHPPPDLHTKDNHSTRMTLLFLNSVWVLFCTTELSTFTSFYIMKMKRRRPERQKLDEVQLDG